MVTPGERVPSLAAKPPAILNLYPQYNTQLSFIPHFRIGIYRLIPRYLLVPLTPCVKGRDNEPSRVFPPPIYNTPSGTCRVIPTQVTLNSQYLANPSRRVLQAEF